ncbi:MAG TPA: prolipoprotein diacylglyceryl transferase, partial [Chromatiales bacterium]|nr:prolipoprotein diacylglyceryl transferase [Chromatiales bacterium]
MLVYPHIDPVAIQLGPLKIHWYGLMYLVGFALAWGLGRLRAESKGFGKDEPGDMLFYMALGVILGGRIG